MPTLADIAEAAYRSDESRMREREGARVVLAGLALARRWTTADYPPEDARRLCELAYVADLPLYAPRVAHVRSLLDARARLALDRLRAVARVLRRGRRDDLAGDGDWEAWIEAL